jgi:hypothetical protein
LIGNSNNDIDKDSEKKILATVIKVDMIALDANLNQNIKFAKLAYSF